MTIYTTVQNIEGPWSVPPLGAPSAEGGTAICPVCGTPVTYVMPVIATGERKAEEPDAAC